jgi:hypothetical protein
MHVLPKGALGQAITYAKSQSPKLLTYLEDGRISIDNNVTERDIRPFATGRKNSYDLFQVFRQNLSLLCEARHVFNARIA